MSNSSRQIFNPRNLAVVFLLLACVGLGLIVGMHVSSRPAAAERFESEGGLRAKPGPWGELAYTPFTIAAPEEALPVLKMEAQGTHWFFKNYSVDDLTKLFQSVDLPASQRDALMDPKVLHVRGDGIDLTPPLDVLLAFAPQARKEIYRILSKFPENGSELAFIHKSTLEDRFEGSGLSDKTIALFKDLCIEHGDYLVFAGLCSMLEQLPNYDEKVRFVKALTRQKTLLLRLRVTPESDIAALSNYWSRGSYATDIRTILESVSKIKGGAWINILIVLPPLPTSQLYFYPIVADNPLNGPPVIRDCHWTSFNFFRDPPDLAPVSAQGYLERLKTNYFPIPGDPRYGDMLVLSTPDGTVVHSAIYLADDVVFTKNGSTVIHPWMLETIPDLLNQYSFSLQPGQQLTINYFRNKSL
jgi:hypothetical protein